MTTRTSKPVLFVDVDGVISLFGFPPGLQDFPGAFHWVDGIAHCISMDSGDRLVRLADHFELVWATGWEDRANEHLPWLLKLPFRDLPTLTFGAAAVFGSAHWKLAAIEEYSRGRPAAWIDDNLDEECREWGENRTEPTLLVQTEPAVGMSDEHVEQLLRWADEVSSGELDTRTGTGEDEHPNRGGPMAKVVHCPCGTDVQGESDDELVANVEAHVQEEHPDQVGTMSREQILEMAHEH